MSTQEEIYGALKNLLGERYPVLESYDATAGVHPSGCIAVDIVEIEDLMHTGCRDCRLEVHVSGFTLADEDRTRDSLQEMADYVLSQDYDGLEVEGLVGVVRGRISFASDGESNEFTLVLELFIADVKF